MNTTQLIVTLQRDAVAKQFLGDVCAADELPRWCHFKPRFWIVNTAPISHKGKHWIVIYIPKDGPSEFFDSLGRHPSFYNHHFTNFMSQCSSDYIHNTYRIQGYHDGTCGQYCLYYVYQRCRGNSMNAIMNRFTIDHHFNDILVDQFALNYGQ